MKISDRLEKKLLNENEPDPWNKKFKGDEKEIYDRPKKHESKYLKHDMVYTKNDNIVIELNRDDANTLGNILSDVKNGFKPRDKNELNFVEKLWDNIRTTL